MRGYRRMMMAGVALLLLAGLLLPQGVGVAGDPEPTIVQVEYKVDPGPGWPAGWTPPTAPTEISDGLRQAFEDGYAYLPPEQRPKELKLKVMDPLPPWTEEYPYLWTYLGTRCGQTYYYVAMPSPDWQLIKDTFGKDYAFGRNSGGPGACQVTPFSYILLTAEPSTDPEQMKLYEKAHFDVRYAQTRTTTQELAHCAADSTDGTLSNIYVCFNGGSASERFDAPAYADVSVGRVRVPLRFVSELMGGDVQWDQASQSVTIHFAATVRDVVKPVPNPGYTMADIQQAESYGINSDAFKFEVRSVQVPEKTIIVTLGSNTALVDGREVRIDAPPVAVPPGRVMVPIRFVAEAMGAKVYWVGQTPIFKRMDGTLGGTYQVHIYTPLHPYFDNPDWFLENRAQKF